MSKDVALQQAKLSYLQNANGRMLSPQYWAGLIIMGDTSPIEFQKSKLPYYIAGGAALLIGFVFLYAKRRKVHGKSLPT